MGKWLPLLKRLLWHARTLLLVCSSLVLLFSMILWFRSYRIIDTVDCTVRGARYFVTSGDGVVYGKVDWSVLPDPPNNMYYAQKFDGWKGFDTMLAPEFTDRGFAPKPVGLDAFKLLYRSGPGWLRWDFLIPHWGLVCCALLIILVLLLLRLPH